MLPVLRPHLSPCAKTEVGYFAGREHKSSPHADEDISVPEDKEQDVLLSDVMKVSALFVGKEKIGFPQAFEHLRVNSKRVRLEVLRKPESGIVPALSQEDVDTIVLGNTRQNIH